MKIRPIGQCKLCDKTKELCESHIVPEAFYKKVMGTDDINYIKITNDPKDKNKIMQKGIWEYLLCEKCEGKFSKYDKYAVDLCNEVKKMGVPIQKGIYINNVDYKLFRLFQLSVLWRGMISSKGEFQHVNFHKKHQEKIKQILLDEKLENNYDYGCSMFILVDKDKILDYIITSPFKFTYKGFSGIVFTFGGFSWCFIVCSHCAQYPYKQFFINEDNNLPMTKTEYYKLKSTLSVFDQFNRQGKIEHMSNYFSKRK